MKCTTQDLKPQQSQRSQYVIHNKTQLMTNKIVAKCFACNMMSLWSGEVSFSQHSLLILLKVIETDHFLPITPSKIKYKFRTYIICGKEQGLIKKDYLQSVISDLLK